MKITLLNSLVTARQIVTVIKPCAPSQLLDVQTDFMHLLIQRMANREESALEAFYDQTLSKVYGLALKITRRHDLAEEVVGDTYWQAWNQAARFDAERGVPMAWLMLMCRTRALDALRKLDEAESHEDPHVLVEEIDLHAPALEQLLLVERESALHIAIKTLTPIQRQLVALAFFKGYTHQEIAEYADMPLGSVKSHIKRAQASLKDALLQQEV